MSPPKDAPDALVLMKLAYRADEGLAAILARKRRELEQVGVTFWEYDGRACLPRAHVQPFARALDGPVWAALVLTPSPSTVAPRPASAFSADGSQWSTFPRGISVAASEHALVADAIEEVEWTIDLAEYRVAIGAGAGASAAEHVRFRVDKACLRRDAEATGGGPIVRATVALRLREPWGVTVRP